LLAIRHSKANSTAICDYFTANICKNQQSTLWQEPQQQQRQEPQNQFQLSTQSHKQEKSPQKKGSKIIIKLLQTFQVEQQQTKNQTSNKKKLFS